MADDRETVALELGDIERAAAMVARHAPHVHTGVGPAYKDRLRVGSTAPVDTARGREHWHIALAYLAHAVRSPEGVRVPPHMRDEFVAALADMFVGRQVPAGANVGIRDATGLISQLIQDCLSAFHFFGSRQLQCDATLMSVLYPNRTAHANVQMAVRFRADRVDTADFAAVREAVRGRLTHTTALAVVGAFGVVRLRDCPAWVRRVAAAGQWDPSPAVLCLNLVPEVLHRERLGTDRLCAALRRAIILAGVQRCRVVPWGMGQMVYVVVGAACLPRRLDDLRPDAWEPRGATGRGAVQAGFIGQCPAAPRPFDGSLPLPPSVVRQVHRRLVAWLSAALHNARNGGALPGDSASARAAFVLTATRSFAPGVVAAAARGWVVPEDRGGAGAAAWLAASGARPPARAAAEAHDRALALAAAAWGAARLLEVLWFQRPRRPARSGATAPAALVERSIEFARWLLAGTADMDRRPFSAEATLLREARALEAAAARGQAGVPWHWLGAPSALRVWQDWHRTRPSDACGTVAPQASKWALVWAQVASGAVLAGAPPGLVVRRWLVRSVAGVCLGAHLSGIPGVQSAEVVRDGARGWAVRTQGSDFMALRAGCGGASPVDPDTSVTTHVPQFCKAVGLGASSERVLGGDAVAQSIGVNGELLAYLNAELSKDGTNGGIGRSSRTHHVLGPVASMTIEDPCRHVGNAAFFGREDVSATLSSNLVLGQAPQSGSGTVRVCLVGPMP